MILEPADPAELRPSTVHIPPEPLVSKPRRLLRFGLITVCSILVVAVTAVFAVRLWLSSVARNNLPQLSGSIAVRGLATAVTITRDPRGVPTIHAETFDDLVFAQGFVTAQDRLFQMDTLGRHASGELAEVVGSGLVPHDRLQRTLSLAPAADRILTQLPPHQLRHF